VQGERRRRQASPFHVSFQATTDDPAPRLIRSSFIYLIVVVDHYVVDAKAEKSNGREKQQME